MRKDYNNIFVVSTTKIKENNPKNIHEQIDMLSDKKILGIKAPVKDICFALQDKTLFSKYSLGETAQDNDTLAAYVWLVRTNNSLGLRSVSFNMPGFYGQQKTVATEAIDEEIQQDSNLPNYIGTTLGQRVIRETVVPNGIFAAVEIGCNSKRGSREDYGAKIVLPNALVNKVPIIAESLTKLGQFHSGKSPWLDYYETASNSQESIDNTKVLALSALYKTLSQEKNQ
jgi:hypothetical protein